MIDNNLKLEESFSTGLCARKLQSIEPMELKAGVSGFFQIFKYKADENGNAIESTKTEVAPYQKNLILNQGLDYLLSGVDISTYCRVGSGSATPNVTNTALQSQIANTATVQAVDSGTQNTSTPYYGWRRATYRFSAGSATGNISEVGVGADSASRLFSRALILDGVGSPTTITILSDEILDVVYELRNYVPSADVTGTMTLGTEGGSYDYNIRAVSVDGSSNTIWNWSGAHFVGLGDLTRWNSYFTSASNTQLSQVSNYSTGMTTGTSISTLGTLDSYTNGNYYRDFTLVIDLNYGNHTSGFGKISFVTRGADSNGIGAWSIAFNPIIPKDNTKKFTMVMRLSIARA